MRKPKGATLLEMLVALAIVGLMTVLALPSFARLLNVQGDREQKLSLAITLEQLLGELQDSRRILAPRAKRGARRAPILLFLNELNELSAVYCHKGALWLSCLSSNKKVTKQKLGSCSAAIFHDRGHTRRCLRIRLRLGTFVLATTSKLVNKSECPSLAHLTLPPLDEDRSSSAELRRAKERYFEDTLSAQLLLEGGRL